MRDVARVETPIRTQLGKGQVALVVEGHVGGLEQWEEQQVGSRGLDGLLAGGAHLLNGIMILRVTVVAIGDQHVFPAVEVHVEEQRVPGPVRSVEAGVVRNFRVRAVTPIQVKRVPPDLRPVVNQSGRMWRRVGEAHLPHAQLVEATEHVAHEEVIEPVVVDVGEGDAHGEHAGGTERQLADFLEAAGAIVDPDAVRRLKIVALVNVRIAVLIKVAEHRGQRHVERRLLDWLSVGVAKCAIRPVERGEGVVAVVAEDEVGFAEFREHAILEDQPAGVTAADDRLAGAIGGEADVRTAAQDRELTIIADEQVEIAVAIDVRSGGGGAAELGLHQAGALHQISKLAFAIVHKIGVRAAIRGHVKVEVSVAVEVHEGGAHGRQMFAVDAGLIRDVLKLEVAEISVKRVAAFDVAEIEVGPAVAIHVTHGDPRATHQVLILAGAFEGERVGEADAGLGEREQFEPGGPGGRHGQRGAAVSRTRFPGGRLSGGRGKEREPQAGDPDDETAGNW